MMTQKNPIPYPQKAFVIWGEHYKDKGLRFGQDNDKAKKEE